MKKIVSTLLLMLITVAISNSQPVIWSQGFESSDSANLPAGWKRYNIVLPDTMTPEWNWTVRTVGSSLPGLATSLCVVHGGTKSIGVSWYAGLQSGVADSWLITPRLTNVPGDGLFSFWLTGGSPSFSDSVSLWVSTDSTPAGFLSNPANRRENYFFPVGSVYGNYEQQFLDLSPFAG